MITIFRKSYQYLPFNLYPNSHQSTTTTTTANNTNKPSQLLRAITTKYPKPFNQHPLIYFPAGAITPELTSTRFPHTLTEPQSPLSRDF